jgi:hypothetical protein
MADLDVRAKLVLDARSAYGEAKRFGETMRRIGGDLRSTNSLAGSLTRQFLVMGGAYVGISALSGAFRSLTSGAVGYTAQMEKAGISVQAILAEVEGTDWESAGNRAKAAFEAIRIAAIKSPAAPQDMLDIFRQIVGPIEGAGFSMQKVLDVTSSAVLAADSLSIDYRQAARDIGLMVRGQAGLDVRTFATLRSMGLIREETEKWNKAMTTQERVIKLTEALAGFQKAGDAFGQSWVGVTSTFKGILQEFSRSAMTPILGVVQRRLGLFNDYLMKNNVDLSRNFEIFGETLGESLDKTIDRAVSGVQWITSHWDMIIDRWDAFSERVSAAAPLIKNAALAYGAATVARPVVGAGMQAGGGIMSAMAGWGSAMFMGKAAAGGGAAAGASAGGGAAAGAAAGEGAVAAGGIAAGPAIIIGAIVAAALGSIVLTAQEQWGNLVVIFQSMTGGMLGDVIELGQAIWGFLQPVMKVLGHLILGTLVVGFGFLITVIRVAAQVLTVLFDAFGAVANVVYDTLKPAFDWLWGFLGDLADWIKLKFWQLKDLLGIEGKEPPGKEPGAPSFGDKLEHKKAMDEFDREYMTAKQNQPSMDLGKLNKQAVTVNNDFRGSRISIKQDFKDLKDPDRVVSAMMSDLTRQAETRISSGYAGAFTR